MQSEKAFKRGTGVISCHKPPSSDRKSAIIIFESVSLGGAVDAIPSPSKQGTWIKLGNRESLTT
jgi:hypothetical protein